MKKSHQATEERPITVTAYAVVPGEDQAEQSVTEAHRVDTLLTTGKELSLPAYQTTDPRYSYIPSAVGLQWLDNYFDEYTADANDIIAVFDFDYDTMEHYYRKMGWCLFGSTALCCGGIFWTALLLGVPCYLHPNIKWNVRNQHVAITRYGIIFIHEQRPSCYGHSCTDISKSTVLISYDEIVDCKVQTAGTKAKDDIGSCIQYPMDTVIIEWKNNRNDYKTLSLPGIINAIGFQDLVFAMKSLPRPGSTVDGAFLPTSRRLFTNMMNPAVHGSSVMERDDIIKTAATASGNEGEDVATLLRDIRSELRQHNDLLRHVQQQQQQNQSNHPPASAPPSSIV